MISPIFHCFFPDLSILVSKVSATFASLAFVGFEVASGQKALSSRCDYKVHAARTPWGGVKTRRTEITAFRRTTDSLPPMSLMELTERVEPESQHEELNSANPRSAQGKKIDLIKAIF